MEKRFHSISLSLKKKARSILLDVLRNHNRLVSLLLRSNQKKEYFNSQIPHSTRPRWEALGAIRHTCFYGLNDFLNAPQIKSGALSIAHHGLPIDMSLRVKEGTPLLVILHGAANEDVRLPFLSGQSISKDLPVSKLSISDPSLYCDPKLNLSWFAGNEYQPRLVEDLAAIISKVSVHCKAPRIVLLGGSGGGFAAINLAARLSNATAVAMNPQTDIFRYHANHVKAYIDLAWAGDRERFITQDVHNLSSAIKASETKPTIVYLQNSNDTFHAINHLQKFTSEVANVPFYKLQAPWRDGHTPPPKSLISQVLKLVVNDEFEGLKQLGFVYHGTQNDSA